MVLQRYTLLEATGAVRLYTKTGGFRTKTDGLCTKNDGFYNARWERSVLKWGEEHEASGSLRIFRAATSSTSTEMLHMVRDFVLKAMGFPTHVMDFVRCTKYHGFCIKSDGFGTKYDGFCRKSAKIREDPVVCTACVHYNYGHDWLRDMCLPSPVIPKTLLRFP